MRRSLSMLVALGALSPLACLPVEVPDPPADGGSEPAPVDAAADVTDASDVRDAAIPRPDASDVRDAATNVLDASEVLDAASHLPDASDPGDAATHLPDASDPDANDVDAGAGPELCRADDPGSRLDWVGFCDDRVDDNCVNETASDTCPAPTNFSTSPCQTGDEPCPATQPGSAAPAWDCVSPAPANVLASAYLGSDANNPHVESLCVYVYESAVVDDEFYVAYVLDNGTDPRGPANSCSSDFSARRHLFFTNLNDGPCDGVTFAYPDQVANQKLSNSCRKAIRNVTRNDAAFDPDVQYFAASEAEARAKLALFDTAEIGCIGIDSASGGSPFSVWVSQAIAPLVLVD